jgi:hypothetical protein
MVHVQYSTSAATASGRRTAERQAEEKEEGGHVQYMKVHYAYPACLGKVWLRTWWVRGA